jgi:hypothetical protein
MKKEKWQKRKIYRHPIGASREPLKKKGLGRILGLILGENTVSRKMG